MLAANIAEPRNGKKETLSMFILWERSICHHSTLGPKTESAEREGKTLRVIQEFEEMMHLAVSTLVIQASMNTFI